ncbi:hypothetical protein O181_037668 [Austropuccinia psidii MF-1]|uniref:Uncharacterized protein n=1 Tax=Austropuccinia psidii MF-1 TaxID=1389203 RepID=A0A9Q3DBV4_9BASI|nr:hypothetical protein [Austropuccinia psidii MF-1]
MKPQNQDQVFRNNPHSQEDIKKDFPMASKQTSPSQYQYGDNITYSEKETLKKLPEATSWPNLSGVVEYVHMELIYHIDVPIVEDYWITDIKGTELKGHAGICDSHFSILAREYLDKNFPNWEKNILPNKEKNFKSASGNRTPIGTIIKEIMRPHRKGNITVNPEFLVLEYSHIQRLLLGTDYKRMYVIDI